MGLCLGNVHPDTAMVEPVLKWAGGKRQLLSEITAHFPEDHGHYHEPFFGGGAVFFHEEPENGSINDINSRLINFYQVVQQYPRELIEENQKHEHSDDYYYAARDEFNALHRQDQLSEQERIREASLLLYLNRTCFNGLYRENSSGEFNVPIGNYANPDWVQADRIRAVHDVLQDTGIHNEDFTYVQDEVSKEDLVYCDPPYKPVSTTASFNDYHAEGFDQEDQRRLRDLAVELNEQGVYVILSNSPPIAELYEPYDDFTVKVVGATRSINSDGDNRGEVAEIIISNVPEGEHRRKTLSEFS